MQRDQGNLKTDRLNISIPQHKNLVWLCNDCLKASLVALLRDINQPWRCIIALQSAISHLLTLCFVFPLSLCHLTPSLFLFWSFFLSLPLSPFLCLSFQSLCSPPLHKYQPFHWESHSCPGLEIKGCGISVFRGDLPSVKREVVEMSLKVFEKRQA